MEGSVGAELSGNERSFGVVVCVCVPLCAEEFSSSLEGSTRSQTSAGLLMDIFPFMERPPKKNLLRASVAAGQPAPPKHPSFKYD